MTIARNPKFWKDGKFSIKLYHQDWHARNPDYKRTYMADWRKRTYYDKGLGVDGKKVRNQTLSKARRKGG